MRAVLMTAVGGPKYRRSPGYPTRRSPGNTTPGCGCGGCINLVDCKLGSAGTAGASLPAVLGWPGARGGGQPRPGRGPGCGLAVRSASATAGQGPRPRHLPGTQGRRERYLARESLSPYPTTFGLFNTGGTAQIGDYSNPTAQYQQAHRQSRRPARAVISIQSGTGRAPEPVVLYHPTATNPSSSRKRVLSDRREADPRTW